MYTIKCLEVLESILRKERGVINFASKLMCIIIFICSMWMKQLHGYSSAVPMSEIICSITWCIIPVLLLNWRASPSPPPHPPLLSFNPHNLEFPPFMLHPLPYPPLPLTLHSHTSLPHFTPYSHSPLFTPTLHYYTKMQCELPTGLAKPEPAP